MIYRSLARPLLYRLPAETAHHLAMNGLRLGQGVPGVAGATRRLMLPSEESLRVDALGLSFPNPVGLAAGFDKDALAYEMLGALGFGFVEVGTLTGEPQPGNPPPRLFRLPSDEALVNRMGFNNGGAEAAARRLDRPRRTLLGINIGKTKRVPEDRTVEDYRKSARALAPHADYLVVNVSSPNTPGLRDLQAVDKLEPLLRAVRREANDTCGRHVPLLVKIAPDLADEDVDAVADLALELALDGIVATNTTIRRDGLRSSTSEVEACGAGGLSGAPLGARANAVMRRLRSRVGARLVLVGVGGIRTVDDAWERIRSGATLVQLYTSFIYEGPMLARRIGLGLAKRSRSEGYLRVSAAVGAACTADGKALAELDTGR